MMRNGFTLIELVMVIVLLGILTVFIAPRMPDITTTNAGAFADKLKADIRYAQNLAMTENRRTRVVFTGTGYVVQRSADAVCTSFSAATDPATGSSFQVTLNAGIYAGITWSSVPNCLEYDSLGRPYNCNGPPPNCSGTLLSGSMTISISPSGSVTVTDQTGAVN